MDEGMREGTQDSTRRNETVKTTLGLLPLIAIGAAVAGPAFGQENPVPLGDVVVEGGTGTRTTSEYKRDRVKSKKATADLKNTPQTVTVVPEKVIEETGATDLVEVLRLTPGISIDAGENAFSSGGNSIYLRGQNITGNIFVDGSRDNGSYRRDTFNIEEVEVVKGVSSANGRGGGAGYVNMGTKTAKAENFARASTRAGFDDSGRTLGRGTVDVNRSLDNFAIRFNAMAEGGDVFGREEANSRNWGVAPALTYGLGTDFRAILAYEHLNRSGLPDSGIPINRAGTEADPAGAPFGVGVKGAGDRPYQGNVPRDTFFGHMRPTDDVSEGYNDAVSNALLARFEYDVNDQITISNQTRWSTVDQDAVYRLAGSGAASTPPFSGSVLNRMDRENETLTNQTNILAKFDTGGLKHTLSAGIDLSRETADSVRGGDDASTSSVKVGTVAAYVYDNVELNERWAINGGARVERFSTDIDASVGDIPGAGSEYSASKTTVSGQIGVVYKIRPEGSLYASYGLSQLPHGSLLSNPDSSRTGGNAFPGFIAGAKPVEAHNYEVGAKWDFFGGDLSVTGALFRTEKNNVGYLGAAGDPDVVYGKQIIQGVELGVAGNITSQWSVFGGLTILDTERKHGADVDRAVRNDYSANGTFFPAATSTNGEQLAYTPNFTANLWTTYKWNEKLTVGGGFQYVGESYIGRPDDALRIIPNGKFGKLPDHFIVNLMASYKATENITVHANIDNMFDETYLTTANWNASWGYLGAPRTYRIGTSFKF